MSLFAMPVTVINLGGEMMYILEQRLIAQKIPPEKACKVITDIVRTMFNAKFVKELFKPQDLYSSASTRQIFDRIAHSSIMRLSESSMDKLYDLMTTGFKYQIVNCKTGYEIIDVTLNHLDSIRCMVQGDVIELVDECSRKVQRLYHSLSAGSLALVRQTVLRNLQDRKVKVSPFLLDGIQNTDASMVVNAAGMLPPEFQVPGQVSFVMEKGTDQIVHYPLPLSTSCFIFDGVARSILGFNLYLKSQSREKTAGGPRASAGITPDGAAAAPLPPTKKTTAGAELNLLGSLLDLAGAKQVRHDTYACVCVPSLVLPYTLFVTVELRQLRRQLIIAVSLSHKCVLWWGAGQEAEEFKLSIFDEGKATASPAASRSAEAPSISTGGDGGHVETIEFKLPKGGSNTLKDIMADLEGAKTGEAAGDDGDDLLALMDSAL